MSLPTDTGYPDSHYQPLQDTIPSWLGQASAAKRQALAQARPQPLAASTEQQAELKRLNAAHWRAQNSLDGALQNLQGPRDYARTLLEGALLRRYGLKLDSETVYLRLYIPKSLPWLPIASGAARTWTVSLLDAALHNFEHGETVDGAFESDSTFITPPSATGQFDTLPAIRQTITVLTFTSLCRELDIGARYQTYLREQLGFTEPVSAAVLQFKVNASQKAALRADLHLARLRGDIREDYAQIVQGLLDGRSGLTLNKLPICCHTLHMMEAPLTGILLIAPDLDTTRSVQRLVAYVPDDPQHPLKEYPSALAFQQELTRQLRADDYQGFFSRFVAHEHRGAFFANLGQRLARITWHAPQPGSGLAAWRKEPTDNPKLQFDATPIQGDVWQHLYQSKLNKILNDARTQAVSTASVDRAARWALWDSLVNVASSVLNAVLLVVTPFVPGLGELMLGYMAWQLLDDAFEGIVDWAEGLPTQAFGHLMSVLESLVQLGAFAAGAKIGVTQLRRVLPKDVLTFLDRFKPVSLARRPPRYWLQDLSAYQQNIKLAAHQGRDRLGLYSYQGESILPLEGKLYAVGVDGDGYVIKHPSRPDAYTPRLQHNPAGAWHSELETPLAWDRSTLLRRLGHGADDLNHADRDLALRLSGVTEDALRKMHVQGDPLPALLDDSLERVRIDRNLQTLIQRLDSDDPAEIAKIDPQDLLQLLTTHGQWPAGRSLSMLDAEGRTTWEFGDMKKPVVQVHETQLQNGELLATVLQALTPQEASAAFGEPAGDSQLSLQSRASHLRKHLARLARRNSAQLFESRYAPAQLPRTPHEQHLLHTHPGLPTGVAARLLEQASGEELDALDQQRTPSRLAVMTQHALTELQLNRADEAQHLATVSSADQGLLPPPLERDALRQALGFEPLKAPARETLRHLGSDDGYPIMNLATERPMTLQQRARTVYPALSEAQLNDLLNYLQTQPGGANNGLAALAQEYQQLQLDLRAWERGDPVVPAPEGGEVSPLQQRRERRNRRLIASQLRRCWRRETGVDAYYDDPMRNGHILRLEYPVRGALPTLAANFDHVSLMSLVGHGGTTDANAFLGRFRQLRHLEVKNINLAGLPPALERMPRLNTLALSDCNVVLTPASLTQLNAMSRLQTLALNNNPLGRVPSVEGMPALAHLDLSHTGIDQFPAGLLTRANLGAALLNDNQLRELPAALFEMPPHISERYDLGGNPFSRETLEQVKGYFQRHGTHWEIDALRADADDAKRLYPSLNRDQLNRLIFDLPGNLEAGQIELARRTDELRTLQQQLTAWKQVPPPGSREYARRLALRYLLERSWRREAVSVSQNVHALVITPELAGELPTLSATLRHIGSLLIQGNHQSMEISHFLGRFPHLNILELQNIVLGDIPPPVFSLRSLGFLVVQRCSIRLSAASRAGLEQLTSLKLLNLGHNPLGDLPDFTRMPSLSALLLRDTGLNSVPSSLLNSAALGTVDLSHNAITHLPTELFALPLEATQAFDLAANPLATEALAQIKRYCQRTLEHFNADAPAPQRARIKRLYPSLSDGEANRFYFRLPGLLEDVDAELLRLESEYEQLGNDLQLWELNVPERHPILDIPMDEMTRATEQLNRSRFKADLLQAWRRESPLDEETLDDSDSQAVSLDTPIMGALPEVSARFDHVSSLKYKGEGITSQVDGTLKGFTQLQTLVLRRCPLQAVPSSLHRMPKLAYLEMPGCGLRLDPASARAFADLHSLEFLDLNTNPLGVAPDVSGMTALSSLNLSNCRLTQLPQGLFQLQHLDTLDLSDNQIEHLPAELLELPQTFLEDSDLSGNPWSPQSLEHLREYYRRTGTHFQVLEATEDADGTPIIAPLGEEPMEE